MLPTRAGRGGKSSPLPNRVARVGFYLLVVVAVIAGFALSFEVGRFLGHREGIAYAEKKTWLINYALVALSAAADETRACHDLAQYLKSAPTNPEATGERLNLAKRALEEPCKNCGGE